jgi:hypothetical protein
MRQWESEALGSEAQWESGTLRQWNCEVVGRSGQ